MATSRVDFSKGSAKLEAIRTRTKQAIPDVLSSWARLAAVECAKLAAPRGTGEDAKKLGEGAVTRDIKRVYGTAGDAYLRLPILVRKRFWKAHLANDVVKSEQFLINAGITFGPFDGGNAHRTARNSRGRVTQRHPTYYIVRPVERQKLERYIAEEKNHVGAGKGGWADAARQIGGTRRLKTEGDITANWILKKSVGLGSVSRGGTEIHPTIKIGNRVLYADQILDSRGKMLARDLARHRAVENMKIRMRHRGN